MAQSVIRQIERNLTASAGLQSRPTDKASIRGIHQGQRSCETAQKGRTHDCKRPLLITKKLLQVGGHPHMRRPYALSSVQRCSPHWHLNIRTVRPFRGLSMVRSSLGFSPQRLHARTGLGSKLEKTSFLNSLFMSNHQPFGGRPGKLQSGHSFPKISNPNFRMNDL
jgi:hypothetical protein